MRAIKMLFLAKDEGGTGTGAVEGAIVAAVAEALPGVDTAKETEACKGDKSKDEPLDDKTELLIRRITDSVTKNLADLLKPAKTVDEAPADQGQDMLGEDKHKHLKRKHPTALAKPKGRGLLGSLW